MPRLLEAELLAGDHIRVEYGVEEREGNARRQDGHDPSGEIDLLGRETAREHGSGVSGETQAEEERDGAYSRIENQVDTVELADALVVTVCLLEHVESDIRLGEAERQKRQREHERVRRLEHAVVRFADKRQEHRCVNEVDKVLGDDVGVAKNNPCATLVRQASSPSSFLPL